MTANRAGARRSAALAVLLLPVLLISVDSTVLGFAVPHLSAALHPTGTQLLWIVDIYSLILACLLVTMGTLGDRIGRRRLLMFGAAGFGIASALAAFATSAGMLIAARALLGVAGATLMPSTLSLIRNIFTDPHARRRAIAAWTASFAGGAAVGPVLGGWLLEHLWWGSVFLINLPVMVVLLVAAPLLLPESRDPAPGRFALGAAALSLVALLSLVFGVKQLASGGSSVLAVASLVLAVLVGALFVRGQVRSPRPMLDLRLFRSVPFSAAVLSNLLAVFVMVGALFFVTQYLQLVVGMSPLVAGLALLPGLVLSMAASLLTVWLMRRVRLAEVVGGSLLVSAAGYALLAMLPTYSGAALVIAAFGLICFGAGITETATNDTIMSSVPAAKAGGASAISETAYELGATLGAAVLGSIVTATYRAGLDAAALPRSILDPASDTLGSASALARMLPAGQAEVLRAAAFDAFTGGVRVTSLLGAVIVLITAVAAWWMLRRSDSGERQVSRGPVAESEDRVNGGAVQRSAATRQR